MSKQKSKTNIYILDESITSTVTTEILTTGIRAKSFDEAISKLTTALYNDKKLFHYKRKYDEPGTFVYTYQQTPFSIVGILKNKPLRMWK